MSWLHLFLHKVVGCFLVDRALLKAGSPLDAILVIFGRRALIFFFVGKLLEKNEK